MTVSEYNECVKRYADFLYRFLRKHVNEDSARDIMQDSYEKLWLKRDSVQFEKSKSYLFTTAYHTFIDQNRRGKKISYEDKVPQTEFHSVQMSSPDLKHIIDEALTKLPEIQKTVLLLRDYEDYSYEEIAEITNLSPSQVKVYIFRARTTMKNYIGTLSTVI